MDTFAIFAIAWIPFSLALVAGFAYFLVWRDDRALRRRADRAADWGAHKN
jgi:Flp pilus assembly protein TadG